MGHSSLLGAERAPAEAAGRDTADLGPSDSSDSGSDMIGIDEGDSGDPGLPVDVALREDDRRPLSSRDILEGGPSDAGGTGERRSAGGDAGVREAADISVDRVVEPHFGVRDEDAPDEDEDPDLTFVDRAEAGEPFEDEDADPVGDGYSDAAVAAQAPVPGRPNPEPDPPQHPGREEDGGDDDVPGDDPDSEPHKPGKA